eukprot:6115567-Pyramimonas_sp.AAC.1
MESGGASAQARNRAMLFRLLLVVILGAQVADANTCSMCQVEWNGRLSQECKQVAIIMTLICMNPPKVFRIPKRQTLVCCLPAAMLFLTDFMARWFLNTLALRLYWVSLVCGLTVAFAIEAGAL